MESEFSKGSGQLKKVTNLGLKIDSKEYIQIFLEDKIRTVEKALKTIRIIGIHKWLGFPATLGFNFKQYCGSILNYGLETINLNKNFIKKIRNT